MTERRASYLIKGELAQMRILTGAGHMVDPIVNGLMTFRTGWVRTLVMSLEWQKIDNYSLAMLGPWCPVPDRQLIDSGLEMILQVICLHFRFIQIFTTIYISTSKKKFISFYLHNILQMLLFLFRFAEYFRVVHEGGNSTSAFFLPFMKAPFPFLITFHLFLQLDKLQQTLVCSHNEYYSLSRVENEIIGEISSQIMKIRWHGLHLGSGSIVWRPCIWSYVQAGMELGCKWLVPWLDKRRRNDYTSIFCVYS